MMKKIKEIAKKALEASKYVQTTSQIEILLRKDGFFDMYELQEKPDFKLNSPVKEDIDAEALVSGLPVHGDKVEGKVRIHKSLR